MALILGAPDTVPAGKMDRKASNLKFTGMKTGENAKSCKGEPCFALPEVPSDGAREVDDMTEFLEHHKLVDLDSCRIAHSVNIVSCQIEQHDVFRSILF